MESKHRSANSFYLLSISTEGRGKTKKKKKSSRNIQIYHLFLFFFLSCCDVSNTVSLSVKLFTTRSVVETTYRKYRSRKEILRNDFCFFFFFFFENIVFRIFFSRILCGGLFEDLTRVKKVRVIFKFQKLELNASK